MSKSSAAWNFIDVPITTSYTMSWPNHHAHLAATSERNTKRYRSYVVTGWKNPARTDIQHTCMPNSDKVAQQYVTKCWKDQTKVSYCMFMFEQSWAAHPLRYGEDILLRVLNLGIPEGFLVSKSHIVQDKLRRLKIIHAFLWTGCVTTTICYKIKHEMHSDMRNVEGSPIGDCPASGFAFQVFLATSCSIHPLYSFVTFLLNCSMSSPICSVCGGLSCAWSKTCL